jgi:hypothetical protein
MAIFTTPIIRKMYLELSSGELEAIVMEELQLPHAEYFRAEFKRRHAQEAHRSLGNFA